MHTPHLNHLKTIYFTVGIADQQISGRLGKHSTSMSVYINTTLFWQINTLGLLLKKMTGVLRIENTINKTGQLMWSKKTIKIVKIHLSQLKLESSPQILNVWALTKISSMAGTWIVSVMLTWKELLVNSISYLSIIPLPLLFFPFPISMLMVSEKQLKGQLLVMHCRLVC